MSRKACEMTTNEFRDGPRASPDSGGGQTVLIAPLSDRLALFLGLPGLVLLVGLSLPPLARWMLSWETALPLKPIFWLVGGIDKPWEVAVNLAIWLVLALVTAFAAMSESLRVTIDDAELRVTKGDDTRTVARDRVSAVFLDGKKLVVLDLRSCQLVRDRHQAHQATIAAGFRRHGYPWHDHDPYADLFRSWTAATPELPAAANDVLAARQSALKNKAHREIHALSAALEKMGYVIRDEGVHQFWRPLVQS